MSAFSCIFTNIFWQRRSICLLSPADREFWQSDEDISRPPSRGGATPSSVDRLKGHMITKSDSLSSPLVQSAGTPSITTTTTTSTPGVAPSLGLRPIGISVNCVLLFLFFILSLCLVVSLSHSLALSLALSLSCLKHYLHNYLQYILHFPKYNYLPYTQVSTTTTTYVQPTNEARIISSKRDYKLGW